METCLPLIGLEKHKRYFYIDDGYIHKDVPFYPADAVEKILRDTDARVYEARSAMESIISRHRTLRKKRGIKCHRQVNRQKYKRCLAIADWCDALSLYYGKEISAVLNKDLNDPLRKKVFHRFNFYKKWKSNWLVIANKIKESL